MTQEEILKQANLDDVSVDLLEQYIKQRKSKEGESTETKAIVNLFHTLWCKNHVEEHDSLSVCHFHIEEQLEDTWNLPAHRHWIEDVKKILNECSIPTWDALDYLKKLSYIIATIEETVEERSLSKLVKAWIDYNYKQ